MGLHSQQHAAVQASSPPLAKQHLQLHIQQYCSRPGAIHSRLISTRQHKRRCQLQVSCCMRAVPLMCQPGNRGPLLAPLRPMPSSRRARLLVSNAQLPQSVSILGYKLQLPFANDPAPPQYRGVKHATTAAANKGLTDASQQQPSPLPFLQATPATVAQPQQRSVKQVNKRTLKQQPAAHHPVSELAGLLQQEAVQAVAQLGQQQPGGRRHHKLAKHVQLVQQPARVPAGLGAAPRTATGWAGVAAVAVGVVGLAKLAVDAVAKRSHAGSATADDNAQLQLVPATATTAAAASPGDEAALISDDVLTAALAELEQHRMQLSDFREQVELLAADAAAAQVHMASSLQQHGADGAAARQAVHALETELSCVSALLAAQGITLQGLTQQAAAAAAAHRDSLGASSSKVGLLQAMVAHVQHRMEQAAAAAGGAAADAGGDGEGPLPPAGADAAVIAAARAELAAQVEGLQGQMEHAQGRLAAAESHAAVLDSQLDLLTSAQQQLAATLTAVEDEAATAAADAKQVIAAAEQQLVALAAAAADADSAPGSSSSSDAVVDCGSIQALLTQREAELTDLKQQLLQNAQLPAAATAGQQQQSMQGSHPLSMPAAVGVAAQLAELAAVRQELQQLLHQARSAFQIQQSELAAVLADVSKQLAAAQHTAEAKHAELAVVKDSMTDMFDQLMGQLGAGSTSTMAPAAAANSDLGACQQQQHISISQQQQQADDCPAVAIKEQQQQQQQLSVCDAGDDDVITQQATVSALQAQLAFIEAAATAAHHELTLLSSLAAMGRLDPAPPQVSVREADLRQQLAQLQQQAEVAEQQLQQLIGQQQQTAAAGPQADMAAAATGQQPAVEVEAATVGLEGHQGADQQAQVQAAAAVEQARLEAAAAAAATEAEAAAAAIARLHHSQAVHLQADMEAAAAVEAARVAAAEQERQEAERQAAEQAQAAAAAAEAEAAAAAAAAEQARLEAKAAAAEVEAAEQARQEAERQAAAAAEEEAAAAAAAEQARIAAAAAELQAKEEAERQAAAASIRQAAEAELAAAQERAAAVLAAADAALQSVQQQLAQQQQQQQPDVAALCGVEAELEQQAAQLAAARDRYESCLAAAAAAAGHEADVGGTDGARTQLEQMQGALQQRQAAVTQLQSAVQAAVAAAAEQQQQQQQSVHVPSSNGSTAASSDQQQQQEEPDVVLLLAEQLLHQQDNSSSSSSDDAVSMLQQQQQQQQRSVQSSVHEAAAAADDVVLRAQAVLDRETDDDMQSLTQQADNNAQQQQQQQATYNAASRARSEQDSILQKAKQVLDKGQREMQALLDSSSKGGRSQGSKQQQQQQDVVVSLAQKIFDRGLQDIRKLTGKGPGSSSSSSSSSSSRPLSPPNRGSSSEAAAVLFVGKAPDNTSSSSAQQQQPPKDAAAAEHSWHDGSGLQADGDDDDDEVLTLANKLLDNGFGNVASSNGNGNVGSSSSSRPHSPAAAAATAASFEPAAVAEPAAAAAAPARSLLEVLTPWPRQQQQQQLHLAAAGVMLPHPSKAQQGRGGEDAFFVSTAGCGCIGVADGVGSWWSDGVDAAAYAQGLMAAAEQACQRSRGSQGPRELLAYAQKHTAVAGSCTALVGVLRPCHSLDICLVGDAGLRIIRQGQLAMATEVQEHAFNTPFQLAHLQFMPAADTAAMGLAYSVPVAPGDVIVAGSDGLFDNVWDHQLVELVEQGLRSVSPSSGAWDAATAAHLAHRIASTAAAQAVDVQFKSPWAVELAERVPQSLPLMARLFGPRGGKLDDITVVVALVTA